MYLRDFKNKILYTASALLASVAYAIVNFSVCLLHCGTGIWNPSGRKQYLFARRKDGG